MSGRPKTLAIFRFLESPEVAADAFTDLHDERNFEAALKLIIAATNKWPNHGGLRHNLGIALESLSRSEEAVWAFSAAIGLGYPSLVNRGVAFEQLGKVKEARFDYTAYLDEFPDDVAALINLGTLELLEGSPSKALPHLLKSAELDPTANWQLADAYIELGEPDKAIRALGAAIEAGEVRAYLDRAMLRAASDSQDDLRQAEQDFLAAVGAGVKWARREFAVFLDLGDQPERARSVALEGIEAGDESCYAPLAVIEEFLGNRLAAITYYERAVAFGDDVYQEDLDALRDQEQAESQDAD